MRMLAQVPEPVERDSRGILDPRVFRQRVQMNRYPASAGLEGLVSWFWAVRWDLPAGALHRQELLPQQRVGLLAAALGRAVDPELVPAARELAGFGPRTLQRMFTHFAGVSPAWVIRRYRLLDAAEAVRHGERVAWADLAAKLGYSDQAHLIRDFRAATGRTPASYARTRAQQHA